MGSLKIPIDISLDGVTKVFILAEGMLWHDICATVMQSFPDAAPVVYFILLDPDGDEYSAHLHTEDALWKIVTTYGRSPGFSLKAVVDSSYSPGAHPKGSDLLSFPVVFGDVHGSISIPEDVSWDGLVAEISVAVSGAGRVSISHVEFIDEDGDSLSSRITSTSQFWRFFGKLKTGFVVKAFSEPGPNGGATKRVMNSAGGSVVVAASPPRSFPVVFGDVHGSVSIPEDVSWDDLVADMSAAVSGAGRVSISHVEFIDESGDVLSDKIDSINGLKNACVANARCTIRIHEGDSPVGMKSEVVQVNRKTFGPENVVDLSVGARRLLRTDERTDLDAELWVACSRGCAADVLSVIKRGADVFAANVNGSQSIHFAALSADIETVALLRFLGCDIQTENSKGFTPFHFAASKGDMKFILYLLSCGGNMYKETVDGFTPLAYICGRGCPGLFSAVYRAQYFSVDHMNSNQTSLMHMICGDVTMNPLLIEELLELGADIELCDGEMRSPLLIACIADNTAAAQILLRHGAEANVTDAAHSTSPLFTACSHGNFGLVVGIVERGADLSHVDDDGNSCLHVAVDVGNERIVKYLLESGASLRTMNRSGQRPLDIVFSSGNDTVLAILRRVKEPLARNIIFLNACAEGDLCFIDSFILSGSDPKKIRSINNSSGMHVACASDQVLVAQRLRQSGVGVADVNDDGLSPLLECCVAGSHAALEWLLENGVDINELDFSGNCGLHLAVRHNRTDIIKALLRNNAVSKTPNADGLSPGELAQSLGMDVAYAILCGELSVDDECPADSTSTVSLRVLSPVAGMLRKSAELLPPAAEVRPVVSTLFDDLVLSFSCLSDSSSYPEIVSFDKHLEGSGSTNM